MTNKKILVLGCNGMAGHMISLYLKEKDYNVIGLARKQSPIVPTIIEDATNFDRLQSIIENGNYDCIINCIGVLNKACDEDPVNAVKLNSYLPHFLERITADTEIKVIHISTDCIFNGNTGNYRVWSLPDADTMYGITKAAGELVNSKDITIRTSIIGPDLNKNGIGLFNWFVHQKSANGFKNVFWTGITTLELAKAIEYVIDNNLSGIYNVVPNEKISKYDLLCLLKKFNDIEVTPVNEPYNDKSLVSNFVYVIIDYKQMIDELYDWVSSHDIYKE